MGEDREIINAKHPFDIAHGRVCVTLIIDPDLSRVTNKILKKSLSLYVACNPNYIWRCSILSMHRKA